ncbi:hypothetical protein GLAREA_08529 [Glarea lozoyensis ATCC 20868]|uniref:BTB domain-containing protein n=1 Tax=Glarea lozoyensis (strain ATCC 20868 / MF5171) TaxID=1116229 RepID=S3CXW5_GLAL2|nr:uncharacterized protein GLAREA_08529 [Glarea lozoyensis ATCC 20868]EPE24676.1 hypothetical protein GLAREA_08529 [Glarea lozoyensis ATCC 20868]
MMLRIHPPVKEKLTFEAFGTPLKKFVGKEKQEFYISQQLICSKSRFFKASCKKEWSSGRNKIVTLEEDSPEIFAAFLVWLTTGSITTAGPLVDMPRLYDSKTDDRTDDESDDESDNEITSTVPLISPQDMMNQMDRRFKQLLECYILGYSLLAEQFQNYIMDSIVDLAKSKHDMPVEGIHDFKLFAGTPAMKKDLYDRIPQNSPLRKFLFEYLLLEGTIVDASKPKQRIDFSLQELLLEAYELKEYIEFDLQDYIGDTLGGFVQGYDQELASPCYPARCYYHIHSQESGDYVCPLSKV